MTLVTVHSGGSTCAAGMRHADMSHADMHEAPEGLDVRLRTSTVMTGTNGEGAQDEQYVHIWMDLDGPGGKGGFGRLKVGRTQTPGV